MSERTKYMIVAVLTGAILGTVGQYVGEYRGRAEMKRWQDNYYQTHPVEKETSVKDDGSLVIYGDNLPNSCEQKIGYMECSYKIRAISKAPAPPKKAKPAKAISAHEALSPIFNMLDVETTKHLTKFYVTIPYVEGHWEIMATDRVNAILRLGSTSWTESEWDSCSVCKESRPVEVVSRERWLKEHCHEKVGDMYIEKPCPAAKP